VIFGTTLQRIFSIVTQASEKVTADRMVTEDCWCYHDAVELGCPALCADEVSFLAEASSPILSVTGVRLSLLLLVHSQQA